MDRFGHGLHLSSASEFGWMYTNIEDAETRWSGLYKRPSSDVFAVACSIAWVPPTC